MATQRIEFTEWTPDQPSIVKNLSVARNVIPSSVGFNSFPLALDYSLAASEDLNNAITGKFGSANVTFTGGATKLFKLDGGTLALENVSKGLYRTITNVALTSNVATITTSAIHGYSTGNTVIVDASNNVFDGTYTITSTPTTTTFTYAKVNANITSASATGTTFVGGYSSVTKWNFTQFGQTVIGANDRNKLQVWTLGTSTTFTDVPSSVATLGTITAGSGYTNGTYTNVQLTYVSGTTATSYPKATIIVSGGAVTSVTLTDNGAGFVDTTTILSANNASIGGTGSGFSISVQTLTPNAPIAKYVTVVRDFVVAANLDTGTNSNKVQWSDINNETNWMSGAASQSDFQIIADGGAINGIVGGEFGLILMERNLVRMTYIGSPFFFQFDTISRNLGCREGNSVTNYGSTTYFLSNEGFYSYDGSTIKPIGSQKIDNWFYINADPSQFDSMSATVDPVLKIVLWNFKTSITSTFTGARLLLIYNWQVDKWSYAETDVDYISNSSSIATSSASIDALDTLYPNLDLIPVTLDSQQFAGGNLLFAGLRDTKIITFYNTISNPNAELVTGDIGSEYNSTVTLARPIIDNGSATVAVASRNLLNQAVSYSAYVAADSGNRVSLRSNGKYHRFSVKPTGTNWANAVAIDVDVIPQGTR
jgi:hypothetical protein